VTLSKAMSWLLRHGADKAGVAVGEDGSVLVDEMLALSNFKVGARAFRYPAKQEAGRPALMRGHLSRGAPRAGRETGLLAQGRCGRDRQQREEALCGPLAPSAPPSAPRRGG
jgi:hypothetical protein